MLKAILIISIILYIILFVNYRIQKNKDLIKFYQIWMKGNEDGNFFVMSGVAKRNKFVADNGLVFRKTDYTYAILPFVNMDITYEELKSYSEQDYLKMCLDVTNFIYNETEDVDSSSE